MLPLKALPSLCKLLYVWALKRDVTHLYMRASLE